MIAGLEERIHVLKLSFHNFNLVKTEFRTSCMVKGRSCWVVAGFRFIVSEIRMCPISGPVPAQLMVLPDKNNPRFLRAGI